MVTQPQPNSPPAAPHGIQELGLPAGLQPVAVDQATHHDDEAGCRILGGMTPPAHRRCWLGIADARRILSSDRPVDRKAAGL